MAVQTGHHSWMPRVSSTKKTQVTFSTCVVFVWRLTALSSVCECVHILRTTSEISVSILCHCVITSSL